VTETVMPTRTADPVHQLVEPHMRAMLDLLDPRTRLVAGYHLGYWDAVGAPADGGGKGIRATLALLSARAAGEPPERGVPAAAAVEFAHNFSLLHDDVLDGDVRRRHRPTAWAVFDLSAAILAGDALLSLAQDALTTSGQVGAVPAARRLGDDVRRLIAGQAADLEFERRPEVTLEECLAMAADKTAALLSCSCALGALLCGAAPQLVEALSRFGAHLGVAFQLVDDLLGIWGEPERTGKPVRSDLRTRKKSLPVVRAATSPTAAGTAFRELYAVPRSLTDAELDRAAELIELSGAREWTADEADRRTTAAISELDGVSLPPDVHRELTELARLMTGRDH
jgi:geranylgeranyl diphosphate synthase type I